MAKKSHGIRVTRDTEAMLVTFELVNKTTEKVEDTLNVDWADVHENSRDFCSLYGLTKILMDRCSDSDTANKLADYQELFSETLAIGVNARERKAGQGPTVKIEVEALAKLKGITVKQAQLLLRKYDKETQAKLFANPQVQKIVQEMAKEAETELEGESFDDLLG